ncbi:MAG: CHRD domain-containing protein [Deltaproteobacteria bacterium]|nr:CHRD domain-containing protein [Deltaproteobacteria bacterium]MBW2697139.1 CHRD domain-containing protein [Deltaproteobacteria bacterium]
MRPNLVRTTLALTILVALLPATASAVIHSFSGTLDGAQANAGGGTGSPGTGTATATLDSVTLLFSWNASWSGLLGTETAAHFHVAPPNTNGSIVVPVTTSSPINGSATLAAADAAQLLAGNFYLNIHTTAEPGGEIRGQLTVLPVIYSFSGTLDGAQANAGAGTGSPGTGSVTATLDSGSLLFSWDASWSGLDGTETAAHFHIAPPNTNGSIVVPVTTSSPINGSATLAAADAAQLLDGNFYLNIHTTAEPGGEIRGQLILDVPELPVLDAWATLLLLSLLAASGAYWFVVRQRTMETTP